MRAASCLAVVLVAVLNAGPAWSMQWTVDPAKSNLGFSGVQTGTPFKGRFDRFEASIDFDPSHPTASRIVVTVDLASARTGDRQRDTALPDPDWFDVAHGRTASFVSNDVEAKGSNDYVAVGHLSLRGHTLPVRLRFKFQLVGTTAQVTGHVQLLRTSFGIGQGEWASGQWVTLKVDVDVDLQAFEKK